MKNYYYALLVLLTLNVSFAQTVVNPVSATTTFTGNFGTTVSNAYNGNGLNAFPSLTANHDGTNQSNSFVATQVTGSIDFDLGGTYNIDGISFWNQNGGGPNPIIGVNSVLFYASTNGVDYTLINGAPTAYPMVLTSGSLPETSTFPAVSAAFIRMDVLSNHGGTYTGFAEIAFSEGSTLSTPDTALTEIRATPNPAHNEVRFTGLQNTQTITVYNVLGAVVLKGQISNQEALDISTLQNGMYLVKIGTANPIRIIKK